MKKSLKITLIVLIIELVLAILFYTVFESKCGSACDPRSLLNPFGILKESGSENILIGCTAECVTVPFPLFYLTVDFFILTLATLIILNFVNKKTQK